MDDKPWEYDLFHHSIESVPESPKLYQEYCQDHHVVVDVDY